MDSYRRRNSLCGRRDFLVACTARWHAAAAFIWAKRIRIDVVAEKREQSTDAFTFALVEHLTLTAVRSRLLRVLERFLRRLRLRVFLRRVCFRLWRFRVNLWKK